MCIHVPDHCADQSPKSKAQLVETDETSVDRHARVRLALAALVWASDQATVSSGVRLYSLVVAPKGRVAKHGRYLGLS